MKRRTFMAGTIAPALTSIFTTKVIAAPRPREILRKTPFGQWKAKIDSFGLDQAGKERLFNNMHGHLDGVFSSASRSMDQVYKAFRDGKNYNVRSIPALKSPYPKMRHAVDIYCDELAPLKGFGNNSDAADTIYARYHGLNNDYTDSDGKGSALLVAYNETLQEMAKIFGVKIEKRAELDATSPDMGRRGFLTAFLPRANGPNPPA